MPTIKCLICSQEKYYNPSALGKFCSHKCYWQSLKGKRFSTKTEFRKGHISSAGWKKGCPAPKTAFKKGHTPWHKGKKTLQFTGKNNGKWMGNKAKYISMHCWVYYHKGNISWRRGCKYW